jgi:PDZ domain-containing protein/aspartyl protease
MKLASIMALALFLGGLGSSHGPAAVHKAVFKGGTSSTGWIDFDFVDGKRIFVPAKINGHEAMVLLATGLPISKIDKAFAASIGLQPKLGTPDSSGQAADHSEPLILGVKIEIGNLTLQDTTASAFDFGPLTKHLGHPISFLLGDDLFNELAVDIDFAQHRIALSDPSSQVKPSASVEVPLVRVQDHPLVPISLEGGTPAQFELGLGNSGEMLIYETYYQPHKLLDGRRVSQRLAAGTGGFFPETIAVLNHAEFAGVRFENIPAAFVTTSQAGPVSQLMSGNVGLPVLARFRLVLDYPHSRLYALPYADVIRSPFPKDRLGLVLNGDEDTFTVGFVAPNSPAAAAGFKVGDKIALINGKSAQSWSQSALSDLKFGASGTSVTFTINGGGIRQVKLADFF